jgi:hypothetical protein
MRRSAVLVSVLLANSSAALGQTVVEDSAATAAEQASPASPVPSPSEQQSPSVADPKATHTVEPKPAETPLKLRAGSPDRDLRSGHFSVGASGSYGVPLGNFTSKSPIGSRLGDAWYFGADLGLGLTRHLQLGLAGELALVSAGSACTDCTATSYVVGPRLRYHLVEGTRFSPWVGYGFSLRHTRTESPNGKASYTAIEPLRLELGGDWYASSVIALGPVLAMGIARTVNESDNAGAPRWSSWLSAGLRVVLDPAGH